MYIQIANEHQKATRKGMREKAKGEMGLGAGELKSLRNDWWDIKTVARTEESRLDCTLIGGCIPHSWGLGISQMHSQYLIWVAEVKKHNTS